MISTAIRVVARVGSAAELAAAALMVLGFPCLMLAALVPSIPAFAAAAAVTYLATTICTARLLPGQPPQQGAGRPVDPLPDPAAAADRLLARLSLADNLIYYGRSPASSPSTVSRPRTARSPR
ncbi:hypothetical protein GCM10023238_28430 [Streptomyces heliomycini]